jgi:tetratricopeptide (TPR) repeat protein
VGILGSAARWTGAALLLVLVAGPELRRYRAERELRQSTQVVKGLLAEPGAAVPPALLDATAARAAGAAGDLPGDARPLITAGAADLLARRPERALERYRAAHALGERAEIDLNAGRAYALLDRRAEAFAAFVRAAWISPALIPAMPAAAQPLVTAEVARHEAALRAGTLAAPPPLPEALAAVAVP